MDIGIVDVSIAKMIVREFRLHATRFDVLYQGIIQESDHNKACGAVRKSETKSAP